MNHPPYSPNLAPWDFGIFSKLKQNLDSPTYFQNLKSQITEVIENIPKKEYLKTFTRSTWIGWNYA
jgi:hypothetical protein